MHKTVNIPQLLERIHLQTPTIISRRKFIMNFVSVYRTLNERQSLYCPLPKPITSRSDFPPTSCDAYAILGTCPLFRRVPHFFLDDIYIYIYIPTWIRYVCVAHASLAQLYISISTYIYTTTLMRRVHMCEAHFSCLIVMCVSLCVVNSGPRS